MSADCAVHMDADVVEVVRSYTDVEYDDMAVLDW
jgi:hypothetical protein